MVIYRRRVLIGVAGVLALESGVVTVATMAWGPPGLIGALIIALFLWDLPVGALLDRFALPENGAEALIGQRGVVAPASGTPLAEEGRVHLGGDLWSARLAFRGSPFPPADTEVRVIGVEGLVLVVEPDDPASSRLREEPAFGGKR